MKKIKNLFLVAVLIAFAFSSPLSAFGSDADVSDADVSAPDVSADDPPSVIFTLNDGAYPELSARSGVLMDAGSGIVIFGKNMDEKLYPASITKLMTVLLALEYAGDDFKQRVYFSNYAVFSIPYGASHIAMDEDETLSLEEALYAIMLASANEVSNAVAEHIAGSVPAFAEMMTLRAKTLGCKNTNFTNPHGLHDDRHYTTAYDMALIMKEVSKHPKFIEIMTTASTEIAPTEKQPLPRPLNNSHKMIYQGSVYYHENVLGGKTGFTDEAGQTLVTLAEKDGNMLIAVDMKNSNYQTYKDTKEMIDYGFIQYKAVSVIDKTAIEESVNVYDSMDENSQVLGVVSLKTEESITRSLPIDEHMLETFVKLPDKITGQVNKGDKLGYIEVLYKDIKLGEAELIAQSTVDLPVADTEDAFLENASFTEENGILTSMSIYIKIAAVIIGATVITRITAFIGKKISNKRRRKMYYRNNLSKRYRYK